MLYAAAANLLNSDMVLKTGHTEPTYENKGRPADSGRVTFDDLLVAVGHSRNRDAFIRLFEHFAPRIKSFLMKGGLAEDMADELAQETMLTVWQKAAGYNPRKAAAGTWIFTIARNKRTDALRREGRAIATIPDIDDQLAAPDAVPQDQAVAHAEDEAALSEAIASLPDDQARLIRKAYFEDLTHSAIAAETNIPLGTVKSRIRLALEKLRYHLGDRDEGH